MHRPLRVGAIAGSVWGLAGYALLWGYTPIVIHRAFVETVPGTVLLLPVRLVLWAIHGLERAAGAPFDFSGNSWWIGAVAAVVGAAVILLVVWAAGWLMRAIRGRGSGGESLPESRERV